MLVRIVRMTFHPEAVDAFLDHFDEVAPHIRAFPGCRHLEMWRDVRYPNVCTTHSHWESSDALEAYRNSDLFAEAWSETKPLFAARPVAQSYSVHRSAAAIDEAARSRGND
jgi:quinol monooxygenase YgiN